MDMSNLVARINVVFEMPDGSKTPGELYVGFPERKSDGFWYCPVGAVPSVESPDGPGADPLQSLCNAIAVLKQVLSVFLDGGGRILVDMNVAGRIEQRELRLESYFRALE